MSYILDALRKSEYARQQGRVPDLASLPPVDAASGGEMLQQRRSLPLVGIALLAVAVAGWWRPWETPAPAAVLPPATNAAPVHSPPPSVPAALDMPTSAAPAARATALPASREPLPAPLPAVSTPEPTVRATALAPPAVQVPPPAAPPAPSALPASADRPAATTKIILPEALPRERQALPATAPSASPLPRPADADSAPLPTPPKGVLGFHELPPAVRERIPRLALSGFSYSAEPGTRLAVINDRVLQQGDAAAPGITLERIDGDGVVLNFSGYRFRPQR